MADYSLTTEPRTLAILGSRGDTGIYARRGALKREMKYIERRINYLLKKADRIVDEEARGDIYGADLRVFQRWNSLMMRAGELSCALSMIQRGL